MDIQLYDFKPTRSQRCRWTFLDEFEHLQTYLERMSEPPHCQLNRGD